ncbi:MAG: M28 family peptidase [Cytophagales bacterium]|nr:M28 family peptidase [Cytophagales bacterium]
MKKLSFSLIAILLVLISTGAVLLKSPIFSKVQYQEIQQEVKPETLYKYVDDLISFSHPRNYKNVEVLDSTASYISHHFQQAGADSVAEQVFSVNGKEYKNVIAYFGIKNKKHVVVGAHYDVCGNQQGADDNTSGVAGLLGLATLLGETDNLPYCYELVAYTLEEPPYFRSQNMGSYRHAQLIKKQNTDVKAMVCLEMIGFFSEEPNSQDYPSPMLKALYPSVGNFIAVVGKLGDSGLAKKFKRSMKTVMNLDVESLNAPASMRGIDFSDHKNYWDVDIPAIMITDTAFMRNKNYHKSTDTIDTLNFDKMADVIKGVYFALLQL